MNYSYRLSAALIGAVIVVVQQQVAVTQTADEQTIGTLAKAITVVINGQNPGSGVIISKRGNTYYVLTAKHVVATQDEYEIITAEGTKHPLDYRTVKKLRGVDLAVVQFTSNQSYRVAQLGDSEATKEGATVYISGWPHPGPILTERIYQITKGTMSGRPLQSLQDGYALVYTNTTRSGMSGGPILDVQGRVIGIHGRADGEPVFNPDTGHTVNVKSGFNLGIPIKTFFDLISPADIPATATFAFYLTAEGDRFRQGNRLPEAIAYYERAIAQDAKYFPAVFNLGLAKYQQGDVEGAIRQWRNAVEIDSKAVAPQLGLAAALFAKGDRERGVRMASALLESNRLYNDSYVPDWEKIKEDLWGDRLLTNLQQLLAYFTPTKTFKAHLRSVGYLAFSPDGQTLVSSAWDDEVKGRARSTIKLWNPRTGELRSTYSITAASVAFAISPDGQTLASADTDGPITVWNLRTGKLISTIKDSNTTVHNIAFSPDGQTLAAATTFGIKIWNVRTSELLFTTKESEIVRSVAFSPDGQTVASGGHDNKIKQWDVRTGQLRSTLTGHSGYVSHLAFSPDGQTLASSSDDRTIKLWNVRTGQMKSTLASAGTVAFSPDGQTLANGGGTIKLWNLGTGEVKSSFLEGSDAFALSPDGQTIASSRDDGTIKIWRVKP